MDNNERLKNIISNFEKEKHNLTNMVSINEIRSKYLRWT